MRFPSSTFWGSCCFRQCCRRRGRLLRTSRPMRLTSSFPTPHLVLPISNRSWKTARRGNRSRRLSLKGQLGAREIWLESNQILLLAQQLQQEMNSGKKNPTPISQESAKVAQIERLARSVQEK